MFQTENMDDSPTTLYGPDGTTETLTPEMLLERGLKEDRFRIDRKKLEDMLQVQPQAGQGNEAVENAEDFFQKVMQTTSTQISWPSKLKIGAKSKKDPHVKIIGKPADVQLAKEMILKVLDTKKNRVTLKMDVSFSDHSYIIGKGGFKIQQVMEETGCHIHFPDSNRNAIAEKSNQVSIAGEAEGVETARHKIRELLPLVFMFELPGVTSVKPGDESSPALQHIQQTYSFNVAFRAIAPGRVLVVVRGCQRLLGRLRQGLILLMECLAASKTIPVMGFMKTEIAVQHHSFVIGINECNLQSIMSKTGASIVFPNSATNANSGAVAANLDSMTLGPAGPQILQSKSSVLIQGSFDSVCLAWQDLLKCLPLVLMFDLKEAQDVDPLLVNRLMEMYNISIMVRPKMRENIKSVILRGAERDSRILFQVRKEILGFEESFSMDESNGLKSFPSVGNLSEYPDAQIPSFIGQNNFSDSTKNGIQGDLSMMESLSLLTTIVQQNPQILGILSSLTTNGQAPSIPLHTQPPTYQHNQYANGNIPMRTSAFPKIGTWGKTRQNDYYGHSYGRSGCPPFLLPPSSNSSVSGDDTDSGIFDPARRGYGSSSQPESSASSTTSSICNDHEDLKTACSQAFVDYLMKDSNPSTSKVDYENKKILATKAMQQEITDDPRTPNTLWSGYGFSKSMPSFVLKKRLAQQNAQEENSFDQCSRSSVSDATEKISSFDFSPEQNKSPIEQVPSPFILSNFLDSLPQHQRRPTNIGYGSITNLRQLLSVLDLEQYYDVFVDNEIDLMTFLTLTDMDLQQLNIGYAARKRMLGAITCMREPNRNFSPRQFTAAPGAERRPLFLRNPSTADSN